MTAGSTYRLSRETVHYVWDNSIPPLLMIESGDTVIFETRESSDGRYSKQSRVGPRPDLLTNPPPPAKGHPLTGPVLIRDAQPGDTLEIQVLDLIHGDWGYTAFRPGAGLLGAEFPIPYVHIWDLSRDPAPLRPGVAVPLEPFLGVMGVALAEPGEFSTIPPGATAATWT